MLAIDGSSSALPDCVDDVLAADNAVSGAPIICRIGHDQHVVRVQVARKTIDKFGAHEIQRAKAVRLKHDNQAAGKLVKRVQCRCDLVGVVREVVNDSDAVPASHDFKAALDSRKAGDGFTGLIQRHAHGSCRAQSGQCVAYVVATWLLNSASLGFRGASFVQREINVGLRW